MNTTKKRPGRTEQGDGCLPARKRTLPRNRRRDGGRRRRADFAKTLTGTVQDFGVTKPVHVPVSVGQVDTHTCPAGVLFPSSFWD